MYIVRSFSRLLFVVTLGAFAAFLFLHRSQVDSRGPVIDIEDPLIEVSVEDGDERFLEGVTASDSSDGDVMESVAVENVSLPTLLLILTIMWGGIQGNCVIQIMNRPGLFWRNLSSIIPDL